MAEDHSDSERGNPLPLYGLLFPISSKDSTYHILCYTSSEALSRTRNNYMVPPPTNRTISGRVYLGVTSHSTKYKLMLEFVLQ